MILVIEGLDACGKDAQTRALERLLHPSKRIAFPRYDGPFGQVIKKHLTDQVALFEKGSPEDGTFFQRAMDGEEWLVRSPDDAAAFQALMTMDKYDAASEIKARPRNRR